MTLNIEMLGWAGTAFVIVAYIPQIRHLYVEKCAWGISISTWLIWLLAAGLLLIYCIFRNDTLFTLVQLVNITAIIATIMLARRSNRICSYHLETTLVPASKQTINPGGAGEHLSKREVATNLSQFPQRFQTGIRRN